MMRLIAFVLAVVVSDAVAAAGSAALPTPEELFASIQGSRERYETFDISYREELYQNAVNTASGTAADQVVDAVWRRSGERELVRADHVKRTLASASPTQTDWFWTDGKHCWNLQLNGGMARGTVDSVESGRFNRSPAEWALAPVSAGYLNFMPGERSEVKALDGGRLMLVSTILEHPLRIEWTVDPALNYAPTECKVIRPDGAVPFHVQSSDFREIQPGMWFPHKIVFTVNQRDVIRLSITSLRVNEPIADDLLEHSFPPGTEVGDRIEGRTYTMWLGGTPRSISAGMWWFVGTLVMLIGVTIAAVWFVRGRRRGIAIE